MPFSKVDLGVICELEPILYHFVVGVVGHSGLAKEKFIL